MPSSRLDSAEGCARSHSRSMADWTIPAPIPADWPARDPSSARVERGFLPDGRYRIRIEHAPLPGITPAMLHWWIGMLDREIEWNGTRVLAYRLWHPRDHIHHEIRGRRADGALVAPVEFRIVEAFQRDPRYLVDRIF